MPLLTARDFSVAHAEAHVPVLPVCLFDDFKPLLGGPSSEFADQSGLPSIYTVVHSVGPSLVITLNIKNVNVLGEELFQISGFNITPVVVPHGV
jgi:hypothetical protein